MQIPFFVMNEPSSTATYLEEDYLMYAQQQHQHPTSLTQPTPGKSCVSLAVMSTTTMAIKSQEGNRVKAVAVVPSKLFNAQHTLQAINFYDYGGFNRNVLINY